MTLPASQQRTLAQIEKALAGDHPGLEPLFTIFTRLTRHEAMPATERVTVQPRSRRPRRPVIVTLAGLAMALGVLVGISLLLPRPQLCARGTVSPITSSASAGRSPACVSPSAKPGSTSAP